MALIKEVKGKQPVFGKNIYLADNATIVGEVEMGDDCSVWFSAVVRGEKVTVPKKYMLEMQKARVRNLSDQEKVELIEEIQNEMMISESFLVTAATNDVDHPGDEKLI